jgi:hypothetical protein
VHPHDYTRSNKTPQNGIFHFFWRGTHSPLFESGFHHPYFGKVLKDKLDELGVECESRYGGARPAHNEVREFLSKHLAKAQE